MPAYYVPDGGQNPYIQVLLKKEGNPKYGFPSTMVLRNMTLPQKYLSGLSDGSDFLLSNSLCSNGVPQTGSTQVHVLKQSGSFACAGN